VKWTKKHPFHVPSSVRLAEHIFAQQSIMYYTLPKVPDWTFWVKYGL
jgi:hypothetical protein